MEQSAREADTIDSWLLCCIMDVFNKENNNKTITTVQYFVTVQ